MAFKIGIDGGGTFTDFLLMGPRGRTSVHKELPTLSDQSLAVMAGLAALAEARSMASGSTRNPLRSMRSGPQN